MEKKLQEYLHTHIPISQAMGVEVQNASLEKVILFAPFSKNINHKETVFGGSLHAVATLACWSLLYVNIEHDIKDHIHIVITHSDVSYLAPVDTNFTAECCLPEKTQWDRFLKILRAKGKARVQLSATIYNKNRLAVEYQATFAAIRA